MPPTTYHLRNESGIEVFTGTILPAPGGGSSSILRVRYAFAFNTPNLLTGVPIYTPSAGDLLPAYTLGVSNPAFWDGTTPTLHLGYAGDLTAYDASLSSAINLSSTANGAVGPHASQAAGSALNSQGLILDDATPIVLSVDDGSGGDPGSMVGTAVLYLLIEAGS